MDIKDINEQHTADDKQMPKTSESPELNTLFTFEGPEGHNPNTVVETPEEEAKRIEYERRCQEERRRLDSYDNIQVEDVEEIRAVVQNNSRIPDTPFTNDMELANYVASVIKTLTHDLIVVRNGKGQNTLTVFRFDGKKYTLMAGDDVIYNLVACVCRIMAEWAVFVCGSKVQERVENYFEDYTSDKVKQLTKQAGYWKHLASMSVINGLKTAVRAKLIVEASEVKFNQYTHLLNLNNGIYDMREHQLLSHDKKYRFNKIIPVDYDLERKAELFTNAIENCFQQDKDTLRWIQAYCGSALLSKRREEIVTFINGKGGTGKSTIFVAINNVLGIGQTGYGYIADGKALDSSRTKNATQPEITKAYGKMIFLVDDTDKNSKIDEGVLKNMANMLWMNLRGLYENGEENRWTASVIFLTNRVPYLDTQDTGTDRRLFILPANGEITDEMRNTFSDTGYDDKMPMYLAEREGSGILNWLLAGLKDYQNNKNSMPPESIAMVKEKDAYKNRTNNIYGFIHSGILVPADNKTVLKPTKMFDAYRWWVELDNKMPLNKNNFYDAMGKENFMPVKATIDGISIYGIRGWRLATPDELKDTGQFDNLLYYPGVETINNKANST